MDIPEQFTSIIRQNARSETSPAIDCLVQDIIGRYGNAVQAVLFYGSCFRSGDAYDGIVDLYVVVNTYRHAYRRYTHALLNTLLPPNVFYLEVPFHERVIRAKYAVFSLRHVEQGASPRWFQSYLWARLAQPMGLVYARDSRIATRIYEAIACAAVTFVRRVLPRIVPPFTSRDLWTKGLALSYGTELRAERDDKPLDLVTTAPHYYEKLTEAAFNLVPYSLTVTRSKGETYYQTNIPALKRLMSGAAWMIRSLQGKTLSILRLLKGLSTFDGGIDYVLWKIERHSGVVVNIDERLRKIPLVGAAVLFWRLYRRGAFR